MCTLHATERLNYIILTNNILMRNIKAESLLYAVALLTKVLTHNIPCSPSLPREITSIFKVLLQRPCKYSYLFSGAPPHLQGYALFGLTSYSAIRLSLSSAVRYLPSGFLFGEYVSDWKTLNTPRGM